MPGIQRHFTYKVYRKGVYLGNLPTPSNDFSYPQDINTAGTQIMVEVPVSADISEKPPLLIGKEDGSTIITAEDGTWLTMERQDEIVGDDHDRILMRNGNKLKVYLYDNYWPNGKLMFSGEIDRWEAKFGSANTDDKVTLYAYSDGQDLDNHVIPGTNSSVIDQNQDTNDDLFSLSEPTGVGPSNGKLMARTGETITVGAGITNLSAVRLYVGSYAVTQNFKVSLYNSAADYTAGSTPLAVAYGYPDTSNAPAGSTNPAGTTYYAYSTKFTFSTPVMVTAGTQYFISVQAETNIYQSGDGSPYSGGGFILITDTNTYAGGSMYFSAQNGDGSGYYPYTPGAGFNDLRFATYYSLLTTTTVFPTQDPATMFKSIIDSYIAEGGLVNYGVGTVDLTGLSVPYTFQLATTYEGIQIAKDLAPANWYWYVDVGTNVIYFKQTPTTATYLLQKGVHIDELDLVASIENVKNYEYFSGGDTGSGIQLFKTYSDYFSIADYGIRLDRRSDNRVKLAATADALGKAYIAENKSQHYQTVVRIPANTMDITLPRPGQTIGFRGYNSFIDRLIIQIVRITYYPEYVELLLGDLPPRLSVTLEQVKADIVSLQTVDNPNSPS